MTLLLLALNLLDLEKLAVAHNAAYQQAVIQLRIAEGQRQQAGLYPNPSIGFNSEHNSPNPAVRWGSNGGFLSQRIVTGNKRGIEKALADREIDEARARLGERLHLLYAEVGHAHGAREAVRRDGLQLGPGLRQRRRDGRACAAAVGPVDKVEVEVVELGVERWSARLLSRRQAVTTASGLRLGSGR
jgi:cobalt-zinc-cadmium efflux system outer membrane protein